MRNQKSATPILQYELGHSFKHWLDKCWGTRAHCAVQITFITALKKRLIPEFKGNVFFDAKTTNLHSGCAFRGKLDA
jgi:hypothetical protein